MPRAARAVLAFVAIALIIGAAWLVRFEYMETDLLVRYVTFPTRIQTIGEEQYAVIPAGSAVGPISLQMDTYIRIDGTEYHDGDIVDYAQWDDETVEIEIWRGHDPFHYHGTLHFYCLEDLPTMNLAVTDGDLAFIKEERDNEAKAGYAISDGDAEHDGAGVAGIKVHGNTTWGADKRSYQLEFEDGASMLDMGEAKKWLLISNYADPSGLLNLYAYTLQQALGVPDAPECRQVDLFINGEYQGLYLLVSKIDTGDVPMVELCGEYTWLEADASQQMLTERRYMRLRNPSKASDEERLMIQQQIQAAEATLYDEASDDFVQFYDLNSWVQQYLLQELMVNGDTELNSEYFRVIDGKLYAGPGWDYDRSLSAVMEDFDIDTHSLHVQGLKEDTIPTDKSVYARLWLPELYQHEEFREALETYYHETFSPLAHELVDQIADWAERQDKSARLNSRMWDGEMYDYYLGRVENWLPERLAFLDGYIGNEDAYDQEITVMESGRYDVVYCTPKE